MAEEGDARSSKPSRCSACHGSYAHAVRYVAGIRDGEAFRRTFPENEYPALPHFYCQGGFDFERLGTSDKIAMKMFFKANAKAAESDPKAAEMLRVMGEGFDGTRREYLEPVLACLSAMEKGEQC